MERIAIEDASSIDGYGDGSGSGSGSGYGDGYGYGDGSGYGYGSGYGDGYGSGYGDGYGYGSGDELAAEEYWAAVAGASESARRAKEAGAVVAIWRSTEDGMPANGGRDRRPAKPGLIYETLGPLSLCQPGTLHATFTPSKWKGEKWWVVALYPPLVFANDKIGSLKREILHELES